MNEQTPLPLPVLNGKEPPGLRRWREMLASGVDVPAGQPGERFISFALAPQDSTAFQNYLMTNPKSKRIPIAYVLGVLILIIVGIVLLGHFSTANQYPQRTNGNLLLSILMAIVLPIGIWGSLVGLVRLQQRQGINKKDNILFGPRTISIAPGGIYVNTNLSEARIKWLAILSIVETTSYIFMFLKHNRDGFAIPKWAFATPEDAEAFYLEAKQYHDAATSKS